MSDGWPTPEGRERSRPSAPGALDFALLGLLFAGGMGLVLIATPWGIGLSPDSVVYLAGARGLVEGHGISFPLGGGLWNPITSWPPFYSIALAGANALGVDAWAAARWLNAALLGASAVLVAVTVKRILGGRLLPALGGVLFLVSADVLAAYGWAWSDPLGLFLGFLGLLWLDVYLETSRRRDLIAAAIVLGLCAFTRYIGLAYLLVGLGALAFASPRGVSARRRTLDFVFLAAVACVPVAIWFIRNLALVGSAGGDISTTRGLSPQDWQAIYEAASLWVLPGRIPEPWRGGAMVVLVLAFFALTAVALARPGNGRRGSTRLARMILGLVVLYMLLLVGSRIFVRAFNIRDARYLLPVYTGVLVLSIYDLAWVHDRLTVALMSLKGEPSKRAGGLALQGVWAALLIAVLSYHGAQAVKWVRESMSEGFGYTNASWSSSRLVAYLSKLPDGTPLVSNAFDALFVIAHREVYPFPRSGRESAMPTGLTLAEEWDRTVDVLRDHAGVVAVFNTPTRKGQVTMKELGQRLPLCVVDAFTEGTVYRVCEGE